MRLILVLTLLGHSTGMYAQSSSNTPLALEILELTGMPELLRIADSAYVEAILRSGPQLRPYRDVVEEWSHHVYDWQVVGPALSQRMASNFTTDELKQLKLFYETPVGQKILRLSPATQRYMADLTFTAAEQYMPQLRSQLRARAAALRRPEPHLN